MRKMFLALITVMTLSMVSATTYASTDGGSGDMAPAVAGECLSLPSVKPDDVKKYMTMVSAQTRFLEGIGGGTAFSERVKTDVQELGGQAMEPLRSYATGEAKCVTLTQVQLGALLKCVQAEIDVIDEAKMTKVYFTWVIQNLGKERTADYAGATAKVTRALVKAFKK